MMNCYDRHSGAGRNPERFCGHVEVVWTPAFAGVTKKWVGVSEKMAEMAGQGDITP